MVKEERWVPIKWYCPHCGHLIVGYKNSKGDIKQECGYCGTVMLRRKINRKHICLDIFAPETECAVN